MIPTPGRIVEYTLNAQDAEAINRRRADAAQNLTKHREDADGSVIHVGNSVSAGDTYPLVIVRCWGQTEQSSVNGQLLLDGNDSYWVTSAGQGDGERQWRQYPRV